MTAKRSDISIRRARVADVASMHSLINDAAEFGLMLPKSLAALYENVREFRVVTPADDSAAVMGVCGLSIVWANLAEVASLVVSADHRGKGLGRVLVEDCLEEARTLGIRQVMTLTYERAFFERCGFSVVDRQQLPLKVWSECVRCPKNQACDEIAMIRVFEDIPDIAGPQASVPPPQKYVVPTVVRRATREV